MCVLKYLHFQIDEYLDQIKDHPSAAAGHPVLLSLSLSSWFWLLAREVTLNILNSEQQYLQYLQEEFI